MYKNTYKNLLKVSTLAFIVSVTLNVILAQKFMTDKEKQQIKAEKQITEIQKKHTAELEALEKELNENYNNVIGELFTKEELAKAMQRQWQYILKANGEEIKSSSKYIKSGNVRIMVAEVLKEKSSLSQEILQLGCLDYLVENMSMEDFIEVYSTVPYTLKREESAEGIKYYYDFINVPAETLIILKLNPVLTEKLEYKNRIKENQIVLITKQ